MLECFSKGTYTKRTLTKLVTRKQIKTISYAFLYGAGDEKLGYSYDKTFTTKPRRKERNQEAYVDAIPGLKELLEGVQS